jgi:predicted dehydrogenase
VGYNRRYAPATRLALECLKEEEGPTTVICSIRAYEISHTNYYYWPKEGTRVAGNACHWIDLAHLLVGRAKPVAIASMSSSEGRKDEDYSITIDFEDGSIAVIIFSTRGENLLGGHEWIDIKRGETSIFIDDFRRMKARREGQTVKKWRGFRQKGHRQEVIEVIDAVRGKKSLPIPFEDLVVGTSTMFHVRESLFNGKQISITDDSFPL